MNINPFLGVLTLGSMLDEQGKEEFFNEVHNSLNERKSFSKIILKKSKEDLDTIQLSTKECTLEQLKKFLLDNHLYVYNNTYMGKLTSITKDNTLGVLYQGQYQEWLAKNCLIINPFNTSKEIRIVSSDDTDFNNKTIASLSERPMVRCEVFDSLTHKGKNASVRNIIKYDSSSKLFTDTDGNNWKYAIPLVYA